MTRLLSVMIVISLVAVGCGDSSDSTAERADSTGSDQEQSASDADLVLDTHGAELVAVVDDRFQSYNVEMVEVTGGSFWSPYDAGDARVERDPIDLSSERLRNLTREIGPAYVRVSGAWANSTYFDVDGTTGGDPPESFGGVLTADQWSGVGEFADAVDAKVVTSFASSDGVRDTNGVWLPDQARALMKYSRDNGIEIAVAEFINEPSINVGTPQGYTAADFAKGLQNLRRRGE